MTTYGQLDRDPTRAARARREGGSSGLALAVMLALAAPGAAWAQRGVDAQLFRPSLDSYGIFTVERVQTSHQWDFGFKLYLNYAGNPLRLGMNVDPMTMQ